VKGVNILSILSGTDPQIFQVNLERFVEGELYYIALKVSGKKHYLRLKQDDKRFFHSKRKWINEKN
jgi:hypothetical protein